MLACFLNFCLVRWKQEKINRINTASKTCLLSLFITKSTLNHSSTHRIHISFFFSNRLSSILKVQEIIHEVHTNSQSRKLSGAHGCTFVKFALAHAKLTANKFFLNDRKYN